MLEPVENAVVISERTRVAVGELVREVGLAKLGVGVASGDACVTSIDKTRRGWLPHGGDAVTAGPTSRQDGYERGYVVVQSRWAVEGMLTAARCGRERGCLCNIREVCRR